MELCNRYEYKAKNSNMEMCRKVDQKMAAMLEAGSQELIKAYINSDSFDGSPTLEKFEHFIKESDNKNYTLLYDVVFRLH